MKIKTIQKGTGEETLYYTSFLDAGQIKYFENKPKPNWYVDKIESNWVDKEQIFSNETGCLKEYTMKLSYQGWKDDKLVFEMFNPDLIIYDTE